MLGKIILFSGGKYDIAFIKQYLADKSFDTVACADSGLEAAHAVGVNVDYIMGDFDSVSQETLAEYRSADKAAKFVQYPKAKDYTDTQMVLEWILSEGASEITILGATGGRLDHFLSNLNILMKPLKQGIPAYIMIDMTTQDTSLVKLDKPIRYSEAEYLNRNIYRHLRFHYPTYIFDQLSFEIDDNGTPYWVCPVRKYTIGLFGGATIGRVVLCNAQTGECQDYTLKDCPEWVDRANPADLLIQQYNYYGTLVHGYINSIFGQKGCLKSTDGYNYMAMEDDVWVYTGVTSVSGDQSNVGFVLINQRTRETRYYKVNGAEEYSAMGSAEGQVQNLGYKATFPILLNISNEPTYFMALKDGAGLVKKYAMVNIQKYQNVAIGDTVSACQDAYVKLLNTSGITAGNESDFKTVTGTIQRIAQSVIDGNSHFYLVLNGHSEIFDVPVQDYLQVVTLQEGDTVTVEYLEGTPVCTVLNLE